MTQRIFWLGKDTVLLQAELARLRHIGYEVYSPLYFSRICDPSSHSADCDENQRGTLPLDVFEKLLSFDFSHGQILPEIAGILNSYFNAVVVVASVTWLGEILRCYSGKVILRTLNSIVPLSQELANHKLMYDISSRNNFWFVPHSEESVTNEDSWLREREIVVPQCLPHDGIEKCQTDWIIFDNSFQRILQNNNHAPDWLIIGPCNLTNDNVERIYIFLHFPGSPVIFKDGRYAAYDGIPRVVRRVASLLSESPNNEIVVTAYAYQLASMYGYFKETLKGRVRILCINPGDALLPPYKGAGDKYAINNHFDYFKSRVNFTLRSLALLTVKVEGRVRRYSSGVIKFFYEYSIPNIGCRLCGKIYRKLSYLSGKVLNGVYTFVYRYTRFVKNKTLGALNQILPESLTGIVKKGKSHLENWCLREWYFLKAYFKTPPWYISMMNDDHHCRAAFIPHYYLFPETLSLRKKIVLYLPDYMPHFFHDSKEFIASEGDHTYIGYKLSSMADKVFCNSNFTKSYLPISRLRVKRRKINVAYLPLLNSSSIDISTQKLGENISQKPYIFYPTRPHPNKNISFLLCVFDTLVDEGIDINLVLTTTLEHDPKAFNTLQTMHNRDRVICLDVVSDSMLACLFINAAALCLTSLAEGNFPPQIHEALIYNTPVVASDLGFITERIPDEMRDSIILCPPNDLDAFVSGCKSVFANRARIIENQKRLLQWIESSNIDGEFKDAVLNLF